MDIDFFALCYFPKYFDRKFGRFHKELFEELKYMLDNKGLIEAFGLPREHGKSTINSFLFPLYSTLYDKSQFTLIISATEQIALPFLNLLKDDTAKSDTKREQVINTFIDVIIPIGTRDTNILVVGTILHEEDLMAELLRGKIPGVRNIKKSAVINFAERDDLWGEWEAKYNNLQDLDRVETAKSFFYDHQEELLEGTEILWSEYLDYYYLMCKKQSMGDKSF